MTLSRHQKSAPLRYSFSSECFDHLLLLACLMFCSLASVVVVVCKAAGCPPGHVGGRPLPCRPLGTRAVRQQTLHGGPVRLRPIRMTPCFIFIFVIIMLHHIHTALLQMLHVSWSVSVCVLGTQVSCTKTAEPIKMPFCG